MNNRSEKLIFRSFPLFSAILLPGEIGGLIDNRQIFSFIRGESARLLDLIDFREENAPSLLWNLDSVTF